MLMRVVGIKEENDYGVAEPAPDFHQEVENSKPGLGSDPSTKSGGSRMKKKARAGVMKPGYTIKAGVDLKRIGHYIKAFLGNYKFTAGSSGNPNKHEFWGGEQNNLPSFTIWGTFDYFEKVMVGAVLDTIKLECSDESMTCEAQFPYKTETTHRLYDADDYELIILEDDWEVMFYDIICSFGEDDIPGVVSSLTMDGKNNLNVENTIGFGSRAPQKKPMAQDRDIELSVTSTLVEESVGLIQQAEYGEEGHEPSACKLFKIPFKIVINICENTSDKLTILFPECTFVADYEASGSDEIQVTYKLVAMGSGTATMLDGTEIVTDMYALLENDMSEIGPSDNTPTATVNLTVKDESDTNVTGLTVKLHNRATEEDYTATYSTNKYVASSVPLGRYDVIITGRTIVKGAIVNVNESTENFNVTVEDSD